MGIFMAKPNAHYTGTKWLRLYLFVKHLTELTIRAQKCVSIQGNNTLWEEYKC